MISPRQQRLIINTAFRLRPKMIGIFGSYARGENLKSSDLDILVDFEQPVNLLELIGLEQELSEKLGVKVDLVTVRSLNPQLKQYIEKDLIVLKG